MAGGNQLKFFNKGFGKINSVDTVETVFEGSNLREFLLTPGNLLTPLALTSDDNNHQQMVIQLNNEAEDTTILLLINMLKSGEFSHTIKLISFDQFVGSAINANFAERNQSLPHNPITYLSLYAPHEGQLADLVIIPENTNLILSITDGINSHVQIKGASEAGIKLILTEKSIWLFGNTVEPELKFNEETIMLTPKRTGFLIQLSLQLEFIGVINPYSNLLISEGSENLIEENNLGSCVVTTDDEKLVLIGSYLTEENQTSKPYLLVLNEGGEVIFKDRFIHSQSDRNDHIPAVGNYFVPKDMKINSNGILLFTAEVRGKYQINEHLSINAEKSSVVLGCAQLLLLNMPRIDWNWFRVITMKADFPLPKIVLNNYLVSLILVCKEGKITFDDERKQLNPEKGGVLLNILDFSGNFLNVKFFTCWVSCVNSIISNELSTAGITKSGKFLWLRQNIS